MTDDDIERELLIDAFTQPPTPPPARVRGTVLPFVNHRTAVLPADAWRAMKSIGRAAFGIRYPDDDGAA